jgi:hypothetical protein
MINLITNNKIIEEKMKKAVIEFAVILIITALVAFLSACNGGNVGEGSSGYQNSGTLYLDSIGKINPRAQGTNLIRIFNESQEAFSFVNAKLVSLTAKKQQNLAINIDGTSCNTLKAGKNCQLLADFSSLASGSYRLQAIFSDKNGNKLSTSQLVEIVTNTNVANQGIELPGYSGGKVIAHNGNYHINLPVMLHNKYENIITSQGKLECNHEFESGAICNWVIDGMVDKENTILQLSLDGYTKQKQKTTINYQITVNSNIQANLLLSEIADIEIGTTPENSQIVVVYNSGNYTATVIKPSVSKGLTIRDNNCSNSLSPGGECTFMVQVSGNRNGNGIVDVDYYSKSDGTTRSTTSTDVLFMVPASEAVIELTHDDGDVDSQIFTGESRVITLDVVNSGTKSITNIRFEATAGIISSATSDACLLNGGESLAVGAHCLISIRITPDSEEANMTLTASGTYHDGNGNTFSTIGTYTVPVEVWHNKPLTFKSESRPYAAVIFTHVASKGVQRKRVTITNPNSFAVNMSNSRLSGAFAGLIVDSSACTASAIPAGGTCQIVMTDSPTVINVAAMRNLKEDRTVTISATSPVTPEKTVTQDITIPIRIIKGKVAWVSESALQGNFRALYAGRVNDICTHDKRNPVWEGAPAKTVVFGLSKNNFEVGLPYINWNYKTEFPSRPSDVDYYHIPGQTLPDGTTPSPIYGEERYPSTSVWNWDGNDEADNNPGHTEDFIWTADTLVNKINTDGSRNTPTITLSRTLEPWVEGRYGICSRPDNQTNGTTGAEASFRYANGTDIFDLYQSCVNDGVSFANPSCQSYILATSFPYPVLFIGNNAHPSTGSVIAIPESNNLANDITNTMTPGAYWSVIINNTTGLYELTPSTNWSGSQDLSEAITNPLHKLFLGESTDYRVPPNPSIAMSINAGPINRYSAGAGDILTLKSFAGQIIHRTDNDRGKLNFDSTKDTWWKQEPGSMWGWASCDTYRHFVCVQQ